MNKKVLAICIIGLLLLIILTCGCIFQDDEGDAKHKMINNDQNKEILFLYNDNISQYYQGKIGPIYGNHEEIVNGAEVRLYINEDVYSAETDSLGNATLNIPQDIIESIDPNHEYDIIITKEHYHDLSWKVNIEIQN